MSSSGPDTGKLLEQLYAAGFGRRVDEQVRIAVLLERIGDTRPLGEMKTLLSPILVRDRSQQERFSAVFDAFVRPDAALIAVPVKDPSEVERGANPARGPALSQLLSWMRGRKRRLIVAGALFVLLVVFALVILLKSGAGNGWGTEGSTTAPVVAGAEEDATPPTVPPAQPDAAPPATPGEEQGALGGTGGRSRSPAGEPPPENTRQWWPPRWAVLGVSGLFFLAWTLPLFLRWLRTRARLRRIRQSIAPFRPAVRVPAPARAPFDPVSLAVAARVLRRREGGSALRLAIDGSVRATIAGAGFPTLVYAAGTRPPDYLLLIERQSSDDQQAALFSSLAARLAAEQVHTAVYFYSADPRICFSAQDGSVASIRKLHGRYPDARVVILGTGAGFVNPVNGSVVPWMREFATWERRAVLTPRGVAGWSYLEAQLAKVFLVLPATVAGLATMGGIFDGGQSLPTALAPAYPPEEGATISEVRTFLGEQAFRWLCACAVYPELHWDLTLALGQVPELGDGVLTEHNVLRLVQLPWMRTGSIPLPLRLDLLSCLEPHVEDAVRRTLLRVLVAQPIIEGSGAEERRNVDILLQQLYLSRTQPAPRKRLLKALSRIPTGALLRDGTTVRLLQRVYALPGTDWMPRRLREALYRNGIPLLGPRPVARRSVTTFCLATVVWGIWPNDVQQGSTGVVVAGASTDTAIAQDTASGTIPGDTVQAGGGTGGVVAVADTGASEGVAVPDVTPPPGQTPPGQTPPGQTPPGQTPPGQTPPGQTPPGQTPPGQTPPGQTRPGEARPNTDPPPPTGVVAPMNDETGNAFRSLRAAEYSQAVEGFRRSVGQDSTNLDAQYGLGASLLRTGDLSGAVPHLRAAARLEDESGRTKAAQTELCFVAVQLKDENTAEEACSDLVALGEEQVNEKMYTQNNLTRILIRGRGRISPGGYGFTRLDSLDAMRGGYALFESPGPDRVQIQNRNGVEYAVAFTTEAVASQVEEGGQWTFVIHPNTTDRCAVLIRLNANVHPSRDERGRPALGVQARPEMVSQVPLGCVNIPDDIGNVPPFVPDQIPGGATPVPRALTEPKILRRALGLD